MALSLPRSIAARIAGFRRRAAARIARADTEARQPELIRAYQIFGGAQQISSPRQPFKGWDLWRLLEAARPASIAEMGSGTTSAVFALWAARHGCRYVAYESSADWATVATQALRDAGLVAASIESPVRVVGTRVAANGEAVGFVEPIPADADFVYLDGPPCVLPDGRKVANDDIARLLDSGALPRTIAVDGRTDTVELVRRHRAAANYRFEPSYYYCLDRSLWREAAIGREHSVFTRS